MKKNLRFLAILFATSFAFVSCTKSDITPEQTPTDLATTESLTTNDAARGEDRIVFTQVVQLEGGQEVPAVNTQTKGIAILRVSESKKLYSKVIIQKLAPNDAMLFAHVHAGAAGVNGPVRINIAATAADFGINKEFQLTEAQYTFLTTQPAYVNAHATSSPSGIVRGQIR